MRIRTERSAKRRQNTHQIRTKRSACVHVSRVMRARHRTYNSCLVQRAFRSHAGRSNGWLEWRERARPASRRVRTSSATLVIVVPASRRNTSSSSPGEPAPTAKAPSSIPFRQSWATTPRFQMMNSYSRNGRACRARNAGCQGLTVRQPYSGTVGTCQTSQLRPPILP